MKFNSRNILFIPVFIALFSCFNLYSETNMNPPVCETEMPQVGETVQFRWQSDSVVVDAKETPILLVAYQLFASPLEVTMKKDGEVWTASLTVPDSNVQVILFAVAAGKDQTSSYQILPISDRKGQPVQNAFFTMALFYHGVGDKSQADKDLTIDALQSEMEYYPQNFDARFYYYSLLLNESSYSQASRRKIEKDVESFLQTEKGADALEFAASVYQMIGKSQKADELLKQMAAVQPDGYEAKQQQFQKLLALDSVDARFDSLKTFYKTVQKTGLEEFVLTEILSAGIALADTSDLVHYGDVLLTKAKSPGSANALVALAGVLSENKKDLNRAEAYVHKAMQLMNPDKLEAAPPSLTIQQWKQKIINTQARYQDVLGWILYQKGEAAEALIHLEKAAAVLLQPGVFYHLAVVSQHLNQDQQALIYYARAIAFDGALAAAAEEALVDLWARVHTNADGVEQLIAQQEQWVDAQYQEKTFQNRQIRPAPDFSGEDLAGDEVVLSDQRGGVVLLCFWATWSKASSLVLDALQELAWNYGEKVLFLTVAMDRNEEDVRNFVRKKKLELNVILNTDIDQLYDLQGVPTIFLIDAQGNIHFEHRGYRPDFTEVMELELDDLLRRAKIRQ